MKFTFRASISTGKPSDSSSLTASARSDSTVMSISPARTSRERWAEVSTATDPGLPLWFGSNSSVPSISSPFRPAQAHRVLEPQRSLQCKKARRYMFGSHPTEYLPHRAASTVYLHRWSAHDSLTAAAWALESPLTEASTRGRGWVDSVRRFGGRSRALHSDGGAGPSMQEWAAMPREGGAMARVSGERVDEHADAGAERATLSRDQIVETAISLVDSEGVGALSMRRLGGLMGVEAMALYRYVDGREDLLDAMVDAVTAPVESVAAGPADARWGGWRGYLWRLAHYMRDLAPNHPT